MTDETQRQILAAVDRSYSTPAALQKYRRRVGEGLRAWEERIVAEHLPGAGQPWCWGAARGARPSPWRR